MKMNKLFFALLMLIVAHSFVKANNHLPFTIAPGHSNVARNFLIQNEIKDKKQFSSNVTIQISNYAQVETEIWFNNQDTSYYIDASANGQDFEITIPEGKYDVVIWAGSGSSRTVFLGYYQNGYQNGSNLFEFDNTYLDSNNNTILIE